MFDEQIYVWSDKQKKKKQKKKKQRHCKWFADFSIISSDNSIIQISRVKLFYEKNIVPFVLF